MYKLQSQRNQLTDSPADSCYGGADVRRDVADIAGAHALRSMFEVNILQRFCFLPWNDRKNGTCASSHSLPPQPFGRQRNSYSKKKLRILLTGDVVSSGSSHARESTNQKSAKVIGFASSTISALNDAELSNTETKEGSMVHMDVDQSFLPIPSAVKASLFEGFARQNMLDSETDVQYGIQQLLENRYGFPVDKSSELIYGDSTLTLFNKLILCCIQEGGTLLFPNSVQIFGDFDFSVNLIIL
ncbi:hypothetical protein Taro_004642 [Colocasia esculenta]|uniref:Uncharacterized protein n=1 Tax=Colocasia esculenta TaxID=4460 RepID=A0A843TS71_COLES|nr:hypothetical protein [Colocasia esculenta]